MKIKDLFGGEIVGTGSDFIVVLKGKNRLLLQFTSHNIIKLKKRQHHMAHQYRNILSIFTTI
jgi:hypothetical protein